MPHSIVDVTQLRYCPTLTSLIEYYNIFAKTYKMILAFGEKSNDEIEWAPLTNDMEIKTYQRVSVSAGGNGGAGRNGGKGMVPYIRFADSYNFVIEGFLADVDAEASQTEMLATPIPTPDRGLLLQEMLRDKAGDVAQEVHDYAYTLANSGKIEPVTITQRDRHNVSIEKFTAPSGYAMLINYGYMSPTCGWCLRDHMWITYTDTDRFVLRAVQ